ncbi:MAG: glycoside hydrolase domain-containing protein [Armatimonadota bacterium]
MLFAAAASVALLAGSAQAAPAVWVIPSLQRVSKTASAGTATSISLYAAKGEYESFQIVLRSASDATERVTVTANGGLQVQLYLEHYTYVSRGSAQSTYHLNRGEGPGWYPDGLIPLASGAPISLKANTNQPIWVDILVPRGTTAGVKQLRFSAGSTTITVSFTVWSFDLPVKPLMKSCILYSQVRKNTQADELMLQHRLMPIGVATANERRFIDTLGLNSTNLGFWANASKSAGTMDPPPSVSTILAEKAKHQSDLYLYDYFVDEITAYTSLYSGVKAWARNLHAAGVDSLVTAPPNTALFSDGGTTGRSAVDVWVELPKQRNASLSDQALAKGDEIWSYNALCQDKYSPKLLLDMAPINYRIQPGFLNQVMSYSGFLYWRADNWSSDPWNNPEAQGNLYPGEGLLVYPGAKVGRPETVLPSMRLKYLRDGVDDYDYVQMLEARGYGTWAMGIARAVGTDWANWTRDPNVLESARLTLGRKLDSLSGESHDLSVSMSANPSTVSSGGVSALSAWATDSLGHSVAAWSWSDGGAGGRFSPSSSAQNPSYTAPVVSGSSALSVALRVTATCSGASPANDTASQTLTVQAQPSGHLVTATASASPTTIASGGSVSLSATVTDSLPHSGFAYAWSDNGAGGTFSPSASVRSPTWVAPPNTSGAPVARRLTVTVTCKWVAPWVSGSSTVTVAENSR